MRQRIFCLVLILALTIPAAGWAKGTELDPNGMDLVSQTPGDQTTGGALFHLFTVWLQARLLGI